MEGVAAEVNPITLTNNSGTNGSGNNGGNGNASISANILSGGGGGGIGSVGGNGAYGAGGVGGAAMAVSITGISLAFGGGGGGGMWDQFSTSGPGVGGGVTIGSTVVRVGGTGSVGTGTDQYATAGSGVENTGSGGGGGGSFSGRGGNGSTGRCIIKIMNSGVTATTSIPAFQITTTTVLLPGVRLPGGGFIQGGSYDNVPPYQTTNTLSGCIQLCQNNSACKQFDHYSDQCFIFNTAYNYNVNDSSQMSSVFTSGYILR